AAAEIAPERTIGHSADDGHADEHVDTVNARHDEIDAIELRRVGDVLQESVVISVRVEGYTGKDAAVEFGRVLEVLDDHEGACQNNRDHEKPGRCFCFVMLGLVDGE